MSASLIDGHIDDDVMTDEQIIKALERCKLGNDCDSCEYEPTEYRKGTVGCCCNLMEDSLALINRQKAELERLKKGWKADVIETSNIEAEAYKEFAERLNKEAEKVYIDQEGDFVEADNEIYDTVADWCKEISYNLVKEMVGAESG